MAEVKMAAELRNEMGKNRSKQLRNNGYIPGILYGKGMETQPVKVDESEFRKVLREHGSSSLMDLKLNDKVIPVIIKEIQEHPIKNQYLHVDFQKLRMDETVKLTVPITIVGRENVEKGQIILVQQIDEVNIECLPANIPQLVEADVSNIDLNTPLLIENLDIAKDKNITILDDVKDPIAVLTEVAEEVEEDLDEEMPEVEVIGEESEENTDEE
ncbi:MAG: 50S ribosomal protein L25 [Clostridiaceae bacterium]|nr:50S ribosomal protein L25 [Clostridiaceae bacterium]MBW4860131.1 50S ribosomal protein L25 [Clostridiaceae bacterium]MBW4869108.1 50S ribosomal protein L25 [Clostridiaceae bacterium]